MEAKTKDRETALKHIECLRIQKKRLADDLDDTYHKIVELIQRRDKFMNDGYSLGKGLDEFIATDTSLCQFIGTCDFCHTRIKEYRAQITYLQEAYDIYP